VLLWSAVMTEFAVERVSPEALVPHPRNYRTHPEDQLDHLCQSIREHSFYRNVVVAKDGTILAGHGVVLAARKLGLTEIPVVRLPLDPDSPAAIKLLVADNEVEHLADQDDRLLSELLKQIRESEDVSLLGTGYDDQMLANLAMVTRPASEIKNMDEAAHWVGMPEYGGNEGEQFKLIVTCDDEAGRQEVMERLGADHHTYRVGETWSLRWPVREREDLASLRYESEEAVA
jgi:hypothetical protein